MPWIKTCKYLLFHVTVVAILKPRKFLQWVEKGYFIPPPCSPKQWDCHSLLQHSKCSQVKEVHGWGRNGPSLGDITPTRTRSTSLEQSCVRTMALGAVLHHQRELVWRTMPPWPGKSDWGKSRGSAQCHTGMPQQSSQLLKKINFKSRWFN